ncbi:MAG: hypothetical protein MUP81_02950 [Dehalococcoidia bacterium]|nr:hypothetical protein [Dehalococcoidia bacterium]
MKCDKCQKSLAEILPQKPSQDWLKLLYYFEHELLENEITNATYDEMTSCLMSLKPEEG